MILHIDSTDNLKTIIKLDHQQFITTYSSPREQDILKAIDTALKSLNKTPSNITSITINPGPGSFTGTRTGVAIANALAFALNIKVNNQNPPIAPIYNQPPNITKPKINK